MSTPFDHLDRTHYPDVATVRVWNRGRFLAPAAGVPVRVTTTPAGEWVAVFHSGRGSTAHPQPDTQIDLSDGRVYVVTRVMGGVPSAYTVCAVRRSGPG